MIKVKETLEDKIGEGFAKALKSSGEKDATGGQSLEDVVSACHSQLADEFGELFVEKMSSVASGCFRHRC